MNNLIPAHVTGGWTDSVYPCYLDPNTNWNGFACPFFTKETAVKVLSDAIDGGYLWDYDAHSDCFTITHPDDPDTDADLIRGTPTEHGILYPVGAYGWCWEVVKT